MYVLHHKQHLCPNWSNMFHCVHIYNTLEGEEKVPLSNAPPFGVNEDLLPLKSFIDPLQVPKSSRVQFYTKM